MERMGRARTSLFARMSLIFEKGQQAFAQAGEESRQVGEKAVRQAADKLRDLHRDSLEKLRSAFVERSERELTEASNEVRPRVRQSMIDFTYAVNEEKVS